MFKKMSEPAEKSENFESEIKQCFDQIDVLRQQGYSTYVLSERIDAEQISLESGVQISAVESGAEISGSTYISAEPNGDEYLLAQNHPEVKRRIFEFFKAAAFQEDDKIDVLLSVWLPQYVEIYKDIEKIGDEIKKEASEDEIRQIYDKLVSFANTVRHSRLDRNDLIVNVISQFSQMLNEIVPGLAPRT